MFTVRTGTKVSLLLCVLMVTLLLFSQGCKNNMPYSEVLAQADPAVSDGDTVSTPLTKAEFLTMAVSDASYPSTSDIAPGSDEAQERQRQAVSSTGLPLEVQCKVSGIRFRLIPAGDFMMGSPAGETDRRDREGPQRQVNISQPFYMSVTEITQEQYQKVMGNNPSHFKGNNLPVEKVSWNDATEFSRKLSSQSGLKISLPTEAQWEYACRAGTTTAYYFGDNSGQLGDYAWFGSNSSNKTHPVGTKKPNGWGLYDMHGNVWQWCQDWYQDSYAGFSSTDPDGPSSGAHRVIRGGCWYGLPWLCRAANRGWLTPGLSIPFSGFRVVFSSVGLD